MCISDLSDSDSSHATPVHIPRRKLGAHAVVLNEDDASILVNFHFHSLRWSVTEWRGRAGNKILDRFRGVQIRKAPL